MVSNCATHVSSQLFVYNKDKDMYCVTKVPFEHDISKRDKWWNLCNFFSEGDELCFLTTNTNAKVVGLITVTTSIGSVQIIL